MASLFSPLPIKGITFRNRIAVSPMCQYSSKEGEVNEWHLVHLGSRAAGGAGVVIQEATAVLPEGRITPGDLGLYNDRQMEKLKPVTQFLKEQGAVAGIQLAHAGRKASCARPWEGGSQLKPDEGGWSTVAPSSLPFNPEDEAPQELDIPSIQLVVSGFKEAAHRAFMAGYNLLEIHAAHGYLIHQFLSPLSNQRKDHYGGSFENRIRLLIEIIIAVQEVWPENLPLIVRISATDWEEGGWNLQESIEVSKILKSEGVDLIDTSTGGLVPWAKIPFRPGYQVPFAEKIRKEASIMTGAVGLITEARQAEEILVREQADLILFGRAFLNDPHFALHAAKSLEEEISWPVQYLRAK